MDTLAASTVQHCVVLEDAARRYSEGRASVEALRGVSFALERGGYISVMGPSGCGKSTLLHLCGGMDRPTSGRVLVEGVDTSRLTEERLTRLRRRHVGFVFQFFNLLPTLSANENVALPLLLNGHNVAEARRRAAEVLELVGLEARGDAFPNQLSGGEQQRVAIARAVVHRPTLLIADEPTGSLDSANGVVVLDLLDRCHRELGVTVLLATHSPEVARRGTGILLMRDGRLSPG